MNDFLSDFTSSFFIILAAEFGDKTNLVFLSIISKTGGSKYPLIGALIGIFTSTFLGIILGTFLGDLIKFSFIRVVAGVIFVILGILILVEKETNNEHVNVVNTILPENNLKMMFRSAYLIFLAELGDRSQIYVITASSSLNPIAILIGSFLGMSLIFILSAIFGKKIFEKIKKEKLKLISAGLFILAGLLLILDSIALF